MIPETEKQKVSRIRVKRSFDKTEVSLIDWRKGKCKR